MFDNFERYLLALIPGLDASALALLRSEAKARKLRRRQVLLREGEVCKQKTFVVSGLLRTYHIAEDGSQYVMKFVCENGWMTEPDSYNYEIPSRFYIDALENSEVIWWTKSSFEKLRDAIPVINEFSESMMANTISEAQRRLLVNISGTAEEKYHYFLTSFPNISRRVPLHMIASYLGVSRETLTRVRQHLVLEARG